MERPKNVFTHVKCENEFINNNSRILLIKQELEEAIKLLNRFFKSYIILRMGSVDHDDNAGHFSMPGTRGAVDECIEKRLNNCKQLVYYLIRELNEALSIDLLGYEEE